MCNLECCIIYDSTLCGIGENQHNDGFDRKMRVGSVGRQMTPKSSLIYSLDGDLQDDEETEFTQEDIEFLYENVSF